MKWKISVLILALILSSCTDSGIPPESRDFNLKFSYGVGAKNMLNTFKNTYTKDLVLDGTITVLFTLSESDLNQISAKMLEINFFYYSETFTTPIGDIGGGNSLLNVRF